MTTVAEERRVGGSVVAGAIAGLAGGVLFGVMMAMMGFLPMVGMLVGSENAIVGFIVHMAISTFLGGIFGLVVGRLSSYSLGTAIVAGAIYGALWWVLGALVLMPLFLGMTQMIFVIGSAQWMSLIGHLVYGVVAGLVFLYLRQRF